MPHHHHRNANAAPPAQPRRARVHRDWIAGTLVELDPEGETVTVRVDSARRAHHARGSEVTLDVSRARIRATDGDGDGRPSLTDLFPGDRIHVSARLVRQLSPGAPRGGLRRLSSAAGER